MVGRDMLYPGDSTDYLIRYTAATLSSTSSNHQVSTVVGIELGREDGKGQGGLCVGDAGCHICCRCRPFKCGVGLAIRKHQEDETVGKICRGARQNIQWKKEDAVQFSWSASPSSLAANANNDDRRFGFGFHTQAHFPASPR